MTLDPAMELAIPVPDRARRATYQQRLTRRARDAARTLCVGVDPSPGALALLAGIPIGVRGRAGRTTRAGAIERFAGLVIESARDHAAAIKPQVAWYEAAGAPGIRALERTIEFARTAGLLVVLDAKRGDVPHTAEAYADAWLGDDAANGMGVDALTVNVSVGVDSLEVMARVAADRHCAIYALLHTSNPGAAALQSLLLDDGRTWWEHLAIELAAADARVDGGVVGAVVGATRPELFTRVRELLPTAPLLVPGVGAQGGTVDGLAGLDAPGGIAPPSLIVAARSLLPTEPLDTPAFRDAVATSARALAGSL